MFCALTMAQNAEKAEYILDTDEEIKRLTAQHEVMKDAMGGLLLAPLEITSTARMRILDSATANGTPIVALLPVPSPRTCSSD